MSAPDQHPATLPILDAGCGTGRLSRFLTDRGHRVEGVDISPRMVAIAREQAPAAQFTVASLDTLPYADAQFRGVLLWYSIIHTPPQRLASVLAETTRVLEPGGHMLLAFQSGTGRREVGPAFRAFGHEVALQRYLYTADGVMNALAAQGLTERARLVRRPDPPEIDEQTMLLAVKPAGSGRGSA